MGVAITKENLSYVAKNQPARRCCSEGHSPVGAKISEVLGQLMDLHSTNKFPAFSGFWVGWFEFLGFLLAQLSC